MSRGRVGLLEHWYQTISAPWRRPLRRAQLFPRQMRATFEPRKANNWRSIERAHCHHPHQLPVSLPTMPIVKPATRHRRRPNSQWLARHSQSGARSVSLPLFTVGYWRGKPDLGDLRWVGQAKVEAFEVCRQLHPHCV